MSDREQYAQVVDPSMLHPGFRMSPGILRMIFRWMQLIFGIPILGYIYSSFDVLHYYAPITRFFFAPVMVLSGLWMWKGHVFVRLVSKRAA